MAACISSGHGPLRHCPETLPAEKKAKQNTQNPRFPAHIQLHQKSGLVSAASLLQKQAHSLTQQISLYTSLPTSLQGLGAFAGQATAVGFWAFTVAGLDNMDTNAYHKF